jgi:hypothetical protein
MRVFLLELKKIWNWRVLLLIAALCALTWLAFMRDFLDSYDSLLAHGVYGSYQTQMFKLYGDSLEPEELADFDIPGKKAALAEQMDGIIANSPVFAENSVKNYAEFESFTETQYEDYNSSEAKAHNQAQFAMRNVLQRWHDDISLDEWYDSPLMRYHCLLALERRYIGYEGEMQTRIRFLEGQPVARESMQSLMESHNASLIPYFLASDFSAYAAVTAIAAVLFVLLLVSPLVVADRQRKINLLQYSASAGRKVLRLQFAAVAMSAFVISSVIVGLCYAMILSGRAADCWNASVMAYSDSLILMHLYDITFGQYALVLGTMSVLLSVGAACLAFVLARFSGNIVTMFIKAVPLAALVSFLSFFALKNAFAYSWMATNFARGKIDAPEVWLCGMMFAVGCALAYWVVRREKRVDVV